MQSSSGFVPPVGHIPYPYHGILPGLQDHDLKRQWLTLLPPPQIIEICLTFDLHVPHYVKSTIWPPDLHAAIATMKKDVPSSNTKKNDQDTTASSQATESSEDSSATSAQKDPATENQPPDKPPGSSDASATPQPAETTPSQQQQSPPPPPPQPSYPFGYPHPHTPSAYPHNPYYSLAHGYPSYPHHAAYPPYPAGSYLPPPPGAPPAAHPYHTSPQGQPPDTYAGVAADDLPSYEEMIVEALTDSSDPEGCAPKDLFAWMATRYPLQSNFRPSASQALQKAFKRGRLEKSSGGKYRLSATWEGGNTSRRTTRRPQTQSQQTSNGHAPTTSPFTHAPLLSHSPATTQPPFPPGPYGYGYPAHPGFPGYVLSQTQGQPQVQPNGQPRSQQSQQQTQAPTEGSTEDTTAAAVYEAAHNILKAINFGGLLQLAGEGTSAPTVQDGQPAISAPQGNSDPDHMDASATSSQLQVQPQQPYMPPIQPQPAFPPEMHAMQSSEVKQISASRTELQAQLALLAAQLAEYAQMDEVIVQPQPQSSQVPMPSLATHPEAQPTTAAENAAITPAPSSLLPGSAQVEESKPPISGAPEVETSGDQPQPKQGDGDDSEDDDDMEEII